ncbi:hypothetical protein L202_01292 [Cryptococcus amylolentus CBS 6039]|uniref:Uncharacterized protein n=2 Tax=Cryptococcus amylolentus TaxID=104669 RepID=A0A1E3I334_9TREE|nr:hypothetical protein L202_01292 [Cryptococcus amylolentus CBS 6039]ODN83070.1 hypothetical protein L202_01292 [Cryptococcus amylolentus CBS 6039]ODO10683.1 hypothetical protein I350_01280 [Cryptococcus amylolentus CBS 6273]
MRFATVFSLLAAVASVTAAPANTGSDSSVAAPSGGSPPPGRDNSTASADGPFYGNASVAPDNSSAPSGNFSGNGTSQSLVEVNGTQVNSSAPSAGQSLIEVNGTEVNSTGPPAGASNATSQTLPVANATSASNGSEAFPSVTGTLPSGVPSDFPSGYNLTGTDAFAGQASETAASA